MTGADVLRQVRDALQLAIDTFPGKMWEPGGRALAALDGCILLTREEARDVYAFIGWMPSPERYAEQPFSSPRTRHDRLEGVPGEQA